MADERNQWAYDRPDGDGVEYLNDEQQAVSDEAEESNGGGGKQAMRAEPFMSDDGSLLEARIQRMDEERRTTVNERRAPHNVIERAFSYLVPYGGILSSGLNLASSSIGAGIISLPYAFRTSGVIMAVAYLVIIGLLTIYSHTLLARAANRTGLRNYEEIVRELMGPVGAYLLAFLLWLLSFGAEISYTLSLGVALGEFLDNGKGVPDFLRTVPGKRLLTAMLWLVFMVPLCIPKEINSLRFASFFAITFIIFFVICMIVHCGQTLAATGLRDDYIMFSTGNNAVNSIGIFFFAFLNQLNMMEVYGEQYKPSTKRMTLSATLGTSLCFILYFCAGLFGYLDFGNNMPDSSLKLYNPIAQPLFGVAYVGIMLKLCVGYGMHMIPVRDATYFVVGTNVHRVPYWINTIVVVTWATISLVAGMFIPRVTVIFGLVGGLSGGFIGYVFPAVLFMYCGGFTLRKVGWFDYFSTYFILIVGVIGVVFGTVSSIYGEIAAS